MTTRPTNPQSIFIFSSPPFVSPEPDDVAWVPKSQIDPCRPLSQEQLEPSGIDLARRVPRRMS